MMQHSAGIVPNNAEDICLKLMTSFNAETEAAERAKHSADLHQIQ